MRRTWCGLLCCLLAAAVPVAASPAAALAESGGVPPTLPTVTDSCVGSSPVTVTAAPWAQRRIDPTSIWPLTRGAGVLVVVVDTGVSGAAPALAGAVRPGTDVVAGGGADRDCLGRGTALAGIVAGRPVSGSGFVGVAPAAAVQPVRITDGRGQVPPGALAAGIRAATTSGADVILVGTGISTPDDALASAVADAVAHDALVVASTNDQRSATSGPTQASWYPAGYDSVLAVTGIGPDGVTAAGLPGGTPAAAVPDGTPAAGLSGGTPTGTTTDAGTGLAAPGRDAVGPAPAGGGHYRVAGSPVAAAYVAGVAALVRAYHPGLDQAAVRDRLVATAEQPAGVLDAYAAVAALAPAERDRSVPGAAAPVALPPAAPRSSAPWTAGLVAAVAALAAAAFFTVTATVRRGRRRRWRSA